MLIFLVLQPLLVYRFLFWGGWRPRHDPRKLDGSLIANAGISSLAGYAVGQSNPEWRGSSGLLMLPVMET